MPRAKLAHRVLNRGKREVITRFPPAARAVDKRRSSRIERYRLSLPKLRESDRRLLAEVEHNGVVVTDLAELELPGTAAVQQTLSGYVPMLADRPADGTGPIGLTRSELLADVSMWCWGLDDRLIDLAENYIGEPVTYYGAFVGRQVADGRAVGARQWHRDIEDFRMLKLLIWLSDVDLGAGPFTYLPRPVSAAAAAKLHYVGGYLPDSKVSWPADQQQHAVGPRWTAVLADTASVFHRALPPERTDRYAVTYTWTSRHPLRVIDSEPFTRAEADRVRSGLSSRQAACLPADFGTA